MARVRGLYAVPSSSLPCFHFGLSFFGLRRALPLCRDDFHALGAHDSKRAGHLLPYRPRRILDRPCGRGGRGTGFTQGLAAKRPRFLAQLRSHPSSDCPRAACASRR